jgi:hypothetical protein
MSPSSETATQLTTSVCPSRMRAGADESASHTITCLSFDPLTTTQLPGTAATAPT